MNKKVTIIILIVFICIVLLSVNKIMINRIDLSLISYDKISVNVGDTWKDPGYKVSDNSYYDKVRVEDNINLNKEGTYEVNYVLRVGLFSKKLTRIVNVLQEKIRTDLILKLIGDNPYYLMNGENYIEAGAKATDIYDGNITNQLVIKDNINNYKDGEYEVDYEITNNSGITKKLVRKVIVYSFNFTGETKYTETRKDNDIIISIPDKQYAYTILPDNTRTTSRSITYNTLENGLYTFMFYDKNNNSFKYDVNITNVDTEEPSGSCVLSLTDTGGIIKVDAIDNDEIDGYEYYYGSNKTDSVKSNSYQINTLDTNASVIVTDVAGNSKTITCNTVDNSTKNGRSYNLKSYTYNGKTYYYWLYEPVNTKRNKIPLVVYFHGDGGRPSTKDVNLYALPKHINDGMDFPFYMAAPYCSSTMDFSENHYQKFTIELINYLTSQYSIDNNRIVMSGGSSGARGAYAITANNKRFSALVIISGITYQLYEERERNLTYLPIWVFHGRNDQVVDYNAVKKHVDNINAFGGNARLTTYEGGHGAPNDSFKNQELVNWVVAQRRKG